MLSARNPPSTELPSGPTLVRALGDVSRTGARPHVGWSKYSTAPVLIRDKAQVLEFTGLCGSETAPPLGAPVLGPDLPVDAAALRDLVTLGRFDPEFRLLVVDAVEEVLGSVLAGRAGKCPDHC